MCIIIIILEINAEKFIIKIIRVKYNDNWIIRLAQLLYWIIRRKVYALNVSDQNIR